MTVVQIRGIPDELYNELEWQANTSGMSVTRYTLEQLRERARDPNAEVFQRLRAKPRLNVSRDEIVRAIRDARGLDGVE